MTASTQNSRGNCPRVCTAVRRSRATVLLLAAAALPVQAQRPAAWTLVPELRIGREEPAEYALTSTRFLAVAEDGTMYLAQPQDFAIRVFDAQGRFVRYVGRRGQGPGEFSRLGPIGLRGDTLWASDRERVHFFTRGGEPLRTMVLTYTTSSPDFRPQGGITAILRDGAWATTPAYAPNVDRSTWPSALPVLRVSRDGARQQDTIGMLDLNMGLYQWQGRPYVVLPPLLPQFLHAFAPDGSSAVYVRQSGAAARDAARFGFARISASGDTLSARQITYEPVAVPAHVRDSIRGGMGRAGNQSLPAERIEAMLRAAPVPAHYPPVASIVVAADGTAWLQLQGSGLGEWLVVDPGGGERARVRAPVGAAILYVRGDVAWGIERSEFDVPELVRYRIHRSGAR